MTLSPVRSRDRSTDRGVVAVVIHYGDPALTIRALHSISGGATTPVSIIVVDNGPSELDDAKLREATDLPFRVVGTGANLGFAGGVNLAMLQPECSAALSVWLLNNDAVAEPAALTALLATCREAQWRALVSSRILMNDGEVWFERARFYPWLGVARHLKGHPGDGSAHRVPAGLKPRWLSVPYLPACSLLVPTEITRTIGGFDPSYFMYGEDVDLSIRAARAGWKLSVARDSIVVHDPSSGTSRGARERMQAATSLRLTARHFESLVPFALAGSALVAVVRGVRAGSLELAAARLRGLSDELALMFRRSAA